MKKNLFPLIILGFAALVISGCSSTLVTVRSSGGATFIGNVVSSITGLDLGPATSVSLGNVTPFYARVRILDGEFLIEPSGFVHDTWHVEFDRSVLPATVQFFTDPECQNIVGVSNNVLQISKDQATNWTIDKVLFLDGRWQSYNWVSPYPQPDLGGDREVNIPRIVVKSTNIFEIVNGTLFDMVVRKSEVGGKLSDWLKLSVSGPDSVVRPGGVYRTTTQDMYRSGKIIRQVFFVDRGRYVGYADPVEFPVSPDGPRAIQVALSPQNIRHF